MRLPTVLALALLAAGCAPSIQSGSYLARGAPARPAGTPIQIYQHTRPGCAVQEIGWVRAQARSRFDSPDELLEAMRSRARAMGGDVIIDLTAGDQADLVTAGASPGTVTPLSHATVFRGTVARFADSACTT